jgi:hypothetical protein
MAQQLVFKNISAKEQLELLERERTRLAEIRAAIDAIVGGAVSASISTAGGSRSFTRASLKELRTLYASSVRRYRLLASGGACGKRPRRIWGLGGGDSL